MALAITADEVFPSLALLDVYGTITPSGDYATHGDTLDFSSLSSVPSSTIPVQVEIYETPAAGTSQSGYVYGWCPGTTLANGKMTVFESAGSAAPLAELAAGAYPAGITGAVLKYHARFKKI